jgi:PAS domain S-box-containing protein
MRANQPEDAGIPDLAGAEDLLRLEAAALEAADNPILIIRRDGTIVWVNKAFEQLSGYTRREALGRSTSLLKSGQHSTPFRKEMWETILSGQRWRGELVNRRKNGSFYHEEMTVTPVTNGTGDITDFIATKLDISERKQAEEQTRRQALTDPLTGLANYRCRTRSGLASGTAHLPGMTARSRTFPCAREQRCSRKMARPSMNYWPRRICIARSAVSKG